MRDSDNYDVLNMQNYYRDKFMNEMKDLQNEEDNLENYLRENSASLSSSEIEEINNRIKGLRSARGEIDQILTGGFY
jgi:cell fate (sporulation/competence/biofilm development) regulator YmcA (YheA/YmcA/DUF963 family)